VQSKAHPPAVNSSMIALMLLNTVLEARNEISVQAAGRYIPSSAGRPEIKLEFAAGCLRAGPQEYNCTSTAG